MDEDALNRRLSRGREMTRAAGSHALRWFRERRHLPVERKGRQDVVSEADRSVESEIRKAIVTTFPGDSVFGEEEGGALGERTWIIDPIDGTANFLRGIPYWSTAVCFVEDGRAELGFIHDPLHDQLFWARRGHGAFRDDQRIRVSEVDDPKSACVGLSYSFKAATDRYLAQVGAWLEAGFDHRRLGSAALSLCHVADGRLDVVTTAYSQSWDVLAGLLIVREAGGHTSGFEDGSDLAAADAISATTPGLSPLVARVMQELTADA